MIQSVMNPSRDCTVKAIDNRKAVCTRDGSTDCLSCDKAVKVLAVIPIGTQTT